MESGRPWQWVEAVVAGINNINVNINNKLDSLKMFLEYNLIRTQIFWFYKFTHISAY